MHVELVNSFLKCHTTKGNYDIVGTLHMQIMPYDNEGAPLQSDGVSEPVLERSLAYWRSIDKDIGDRIARGVEGG